MTRRIKQCVWWYIAGAQHPSDRQRREPQSLPHKGIVHPSGNFRELPSTPIPTTLLIRTSTWLWFLSIFFSFRLVLRESSNKDGQMPRGDHFLSCGLMPSGSVCPIRLFQLFWRAHWNHRRRRRQSKRSFHASQTTYCSSGWSLIIRDTDLVLVIFGSYMISQVSCPALRSRPTSTDIEAGEAHTRGRQKDSSNTLSNREI